MVTCNYCDTTIDQDAVDGWCVYRCNDCRKVNVMLAQADGVAEIFDHYELIEEVGQGANAAVVRAVDKSDGTPVALKLFLTVGVDSHDDHSIKEFTRESEMVMEIVHQNIVR